jgi:hypothetical protein
MNSAQSFHLCHPYNPHLKTHLLKAKVREVHWFALPTLEIEGSLHQMASTFRSFPERATLEAALSLAEGVMNFAVTICDHPQAVHGRQMMDAESM